MGEESWLAEQLTPLVGMMSKEVEAHGHRLRSGLVSRDQEHRCEALHLVRRQMPTVELGLEQEAEEVVPWLFTFQRDQA